MHPEIDTSHYFTFFAIFIKLLEKFSSFCQLLQILCLSKDFYPFFLLTSITESPVRDIAKRISQIPKGSPVAGTLSSS